ncbi:MAG TPA: ThuA domain-containing protein [Solirubrobacter sp.]|nr:ThuA domain-containing protein [Solirubrobacter sp.]
MLATAAIGVAPAAADAGKVLVFTGTADTTNPASAAAATAITALGTANDFTVDTSSNAADIAVDKLAGYRAVVFVNSSGNVLDASQESALQSYVQSGGGFVGIGETARLEQGNPFFDTLIGLTGASRTSGTATESTQDVEFLDRVHPATRDLPMLQKGHNDVYYSWTNNPTGLVHTVARVRFNELPDGTSVTNDAITRFTGSTNTNQPQLERPVSWCRDVQQGRSFYTGLGGTAGNWSGTSAVTKHVLGAIQWAAGMTRGNCKATITSNFQATRITPPNPSTTSNAYIGEVDGVSMAKDGRVFYAGRAVCTQGQSQVTNWASANVGLGCGTLHVWDPAVAGSGSENQDPAKITKIGEFQVFGAKGGGGETGATSKTEQGILGILLDPDFTNGRPYIYIQYHPYYGGEQGYPVGSMQGGTKSFGPGFVRADYMGERRVSRFTYDNATKSIVPGSEKVVFHWMTQVFSCCHLGGSMDWDSQGNMYFATGDNTGNTPNSNNGGYVNSSPTHTVPCPGGPTNQYVGTGCGITQPCDDASPGGYARCGHISYADVRQTSANTNAYEGKLLRIKPLANPGDTPGIGTTYTIPGADAPNGPQLFPPDSQAVKDGKAKPEVFAMGTRNLYSVDIDPKTDKITTAWVGPDQGTDSTTYGPAKTENAAIMGKAGNYGWPYCQGGNRHGYRAKLPAATGGGAGANLSDNIRGTVGGGADGQTGAYWDCSKSLPNDSPFNTGLTDIPAPSPVNIWYGPQGGCYDYPKNANGIDIISANSNTTPAPATFRRCPYIIGGSQAPISGGIYRKPAGSAPNAWPAYWDGRWFLADFSVANNVRHAFLMDPSDDTKGGQPVSADSLLPMIPSTLIGSNRIIDVDFGPDGALYVASYSGSFFSISNTNTALWKFSYVGGDDTPGPDPKAQPAATSSRVDFNVGKSGGVSYAWTFDDGATATGATATHAFLTGGTHSATLTVTYADGAKESKDVTFEVPTSVSASVSATVIPTLSLTLSGSATFGTFQPAVTNTYTASTTANVVSTAGNALLSVADTSGTAAGHMVNGTSVLAQALKVRATDAANPNTAYKELTGSAQELLSYPREISNDAVTLQFQQPIAATDALRSGSYSKTLTYTLSTTAP